uniref:Mini-chromosome maintenance complex-binding protein n=1 Tax=Ditylenchus dipsaci TaxID=166011 RepID=A0A915EJC9_9BILA
MQRNMKFKQKWLSRDELKRICILKKGSNGMDVTFQDVDTGAIVEIHENSFAIEWNDRICRAPKEIAEWRKPLVLPFSLSTKFDSKYRSDPQSIAEFRKLIPDEKVFFYNKLELEEDDESMADAKVFGKHSQETSKKMSMPEPKEVLLFKSDGSNINDCFDQIVMKIAKIFPVISLLRSNRMHTIVHLNPPKFVKVQSWVSRWKQACLNMEIREAAPLLLSIVTLILSCSTMILYKATTRMDQWIAVGDAVAIFFPTFFGLQIVKKVLTTDKKLIFLFFSRSAAFFVMLIVHFITDEHYYASILYGAGISYILWEIIESSSSIQTLRRISYTPPPPPPRPSLAALYPTEQQQQPFPANIKGSMKQRRPGGTPFASQESFEHNLRQVCRIGNVYERCRVEKMDTGSYQIYLVDSAKFSEVPATDLFHIDAASFGGDLDYGFILRCSTPAPDYLEALKLPNLNQFRVNEVVEVIISSLFEPCLAVLGSTTKHFSRIRAESIIQGMSGEDTQSRQINFLDPEPSLSGVTSGQYPPAQPYLFEMFTLLTVVAFISLEKVFIRDILSCIRLSFLQEIINDFYGADQCRQQMQFLDCADPLPDLPCVVFDEVSKQYLRAKILRLSGDRTIADVLAVDYPDVVVKEIELGSLYLLSDRFKLQPQCFSVRLAGIVDDEELYHFSSIAEHF